MDYKIKSPFFDIGQTFLCGQCFRWKAAEDPEYAFEGIAMGRKIRLSQEKGEVVLHNIEEEDIPLWENYFDLQTDYGAFISRFSADDTLNSACKGSSGIRILRQEPFETLISFIISQNNNIPRIAGIIGRLCESFGEKIEGGYAFPDAKRLKGIAPDDLAPLRAGFRARYICDAVDKINSGEVSFEKIDALPLDEARAELKKIVGVGDKVADCVLLFGFHKLDAFPKDVWVKRIMSELYPNGLPDCVKGAEGVAQQYLFHFVRNNNGLEIIQGLKV
ncbi:MAG: DNA-3-methyladenine glycosylase 2 [Oscillospiraceae bacterium]|nr:DNA-3-methyladenine glycosylase 2 [Oscillospiraceae bacterium]